MPRRSCSEPVTPRIIWPTRDERRGRLHALTGTASARGCSPRDACVGSRRDPRGCARTHQKSADECARGRGPEARGYYEQGPPAVGQRLAGRSPLNRWVPPRTGKCDERHARRMVTQSTRKWAASCLCHTTDTSHHRTCSLPPRIIGNTIRYPVQRRSTSAGITGPRV